MEKGPFPGLSSFADIDGSFLVRFFRASPANNHPSVKATPDVYEWNSSSGNGVQKAGSSMNSIPGSVLSALIHAYLSLAPAARLTQEALVEASSSSLPTSLNLHFPPQSLPVAR